MAKRTRGSHRPGRRHERRSGRPQQRFEQRFEPRYAPPPGQGLTAEEEARAAELEEQFLARERTAGADRAAVREADRSREATDDRSARPRGLLAVRAAEEYAYVARDVRRIIRVASLMVAMLVVAWLLVDVLGVVKVS
jgi:hypothetical protein